MQLAATARRWAAPILAGALLVALAGAEHWRAWTAIAGARRWFGADAPAEVSALFTLAVIGHAALGGIGAMTWLVRRGLPRGAALAGAMLLVITPAASGLVSWRLLFGLAWVPWALAAIDAWAAKPRAAAAAIAGAALAVVALDGGLVAIQIALIVVVPVAAGELATQERRAALTTGAIIAAIAGAAAIAVAIAGAPSIAAPRLPADALAALVLPRRAPGPYVTLLALGASACALALDRRAQTIALAAAAATGVVLALGVSASALDATRVALAGLTAHGLAALAAIPDDDAGNRTRRTITTALAIAAAVAGAAYGLGFVSISAAWDKPSPLRDACAIGVTSAWVACWTLHAIATHADAAARRRLTMIAAVVVALDLWFAQQPALEKTWRPLPRPPAAVTSPR